MAFPPTLVVVNPCCQWYCWSCGVDVQWASFAGSCLQECHSSAEKSFETQQSLQRQAPRGTSRPIGGSQTRSQAHLVRGTAQEMIPHFGTHNSQGPLLKAGRWRCLRFHHGEMQSFGASLFDHRRLARDGCQEAVLGLCLVVVCLLGELR